jgi:hypothetical protein
MPDLSPLDSFLTWLNNLPFFQAFSESAAFPLFEALHVLGLAVLIGAIGILDLRLLNLAGRSETVTSLSRTTIPWSWAGFGLALITGLFLFAGDALAYAHNAAFQVKMALLILAGANMAAFHALTWPSVAQWDHAKTTLAAKVAGGLSLLFWCGVVFAGRYVAFVI